MSASGSIITSNGPRGFRPGERLPTEVPFGTGLLDTYPASMAYSFRKLRAAQTLCCKVRNGDNQEADIGFAYNATYGGWFVDTQALLAHAGVGGTAAIVTWYDQSGNGRHVSSPIGGSQPQIVTAGSLRTSGGKPAAYFGQYQALYTSNPGWAFPTGAYCAMAYGVVNADDTSPAGYGFMFDTGRNGSGSRKWGAFVQTTHDRWLRQMGSYDALWNVGFDHVGSTGGQNYDWLAGHHQLTVKGDHRHPANGGICVFRRDTVDNSQYGYANSSQVFDSNTVYCFALGGQWTNPYDGNNFLGYMGEWVFYNDYGDNSTAIQLNQKNGWGTP